MATSVLTYVRQLKVAEYALAKQMGSDLTTSSKELRVALLAATAATAVLAKALVDQGVLTNAQLQAALTAAQAETFPEQGNSQDTDM